MKLFVVLLAIVAACASSSIPQIPGDNSHYVEGESRYIWMPDGHGVPHLVDLEEPADETLLNDVTRNGANNQYWLYTRRNPTNPQVIVHGNVATVQNSQYCHPCWTKVIVHGWNNNGNSDVNPFIRDAYLAIADFNVIVVDWSQLAGASYTSAANGVPNVGQHLGDFLIWLMQHTNGNWANLHLIGFSLGAHVVGNAGRRAHGWAGRVTGLDPAGPTWGGNSNALNVNAGRYVEAIHTDGGILGIFDPIAHADFYPNGGRNMQPGCWLSLCSHGRSYELFAASLWHDHLVGRLCPNLWDAQNVNCHGAALHMGNHHMNKWGQGIYGLHTGSNWPF